MNEVYKLTVGQIREMLAYEPSDETLDEFLDGVDIGELFKVADGYEDEDDDEEELDDYSDFWGMDDDPDEYEVGSDDLDDPDREQMAHQIAHEVNHGMYNMLLVEDLYPNDRELIDRVQFLIAQGI